MVGLRSLVIAMAFLVAALAACAAEDSAEEWLNRAADAGASARSREYAAGRVLMLADKSASILVSALQGVGSDRALRRQVAARLLGELAPPEAEGPLLAAALGPDYFLAEAAGEALARYYARKSDGELYTLLTKGARALRLPTAKDGPIQGQAAETGDAALPDSIGGTPEWVALSLDQAKYRGRFQALVMRGLARKYRGTGQALPEPLVWCVWEGLLDSDAALRRAAVEMTPYVGSSQGPERLAAFLYTETDPGILCAALRAFQEMRPPEFGEAVERQVGHANPLVSLEALAALDAMGYRGSIFPLSGVKPAAGRTVAGFVTHPSTPVRRRAIELLAKKMDPAALPYLEAALFDRVGANRAAAAKALGEMGLTAGVGTLSPLLHDGRPEARSAAAVALAKLGVIGVASRLVDEYSGGEMPFRLAAAEALGKIGDKRAVGALTEGLRSRDAELAAASAEALGNIGDKAAGPALFELLTKTADPVLVDTARKALRRIFSDDPGGDPGKWQEWGKRVMTVNGQDAISPNAPAIP